MPMIRVNLAARLLVVVERTGTLALRHRQGDEVARCNRVGEAGDKSSSAALAMSGWAVSSRRTPRPRARLAPARLRPGRLSGRRCFEWSPAVNLAVAAGRRPHRRLRASPAPRHQERLRRLDHEFVVAWKTVDQPRARRAPEPQREIARDPCTAFSRNVPYRARSGGLALSKNSTSARRLRTGLGQGAPG